MSDERNHANQVSEYYDVLMADFHAILRWIIDRNVMFESEDFHDMTDLFVERKLLEHVPFNPEIHGEVECADPGDLIYAWTEKAKRIARKT